jgi:hypothetical protein
MTLTARERKTREREPDEEDEEQERERGERKNLMRKCHNPIFTHGIFSGVGA